ncbi:MAG: AAA family ATPase, partial [bacterium]
MKIEKMTATFGTLNHATLEPGPGLTVIEAPNEAGKSTWCAFIRAMLYGVDTSERDKAGHLALKTRMKPWNNMPTVGTMELETGGKHITIQRYNQKNIPFARLTATYTGTAQHVPELTAANLGETLTGVTEDVFARTAYIRRPELQVNQTADLERRIASLVQTGDETSAFTEVEGELTSWQRKLTYGRSGEIPRLEAELREAEAAANALSASAAELGRLREQCARLEAQIAGYEKDLATHDRLEARSRARLLAQAKAQLAEREERTAALTRAATKNGQLMTLENTRQIREAAASFQPLRRIRDEAEKTLFAAEKDLNDVSVRKASSPLAGLSEQEASELSRRGRELAAKAEEKKRKPLPRFIPGLLIALAAVCLLFTSGALLPFTQWVSGLAPYVGFRWQGLALGAALLALGLWLLLKKPAQPAAAKELAALLEKYGVSSAEKLSSLSSAYLAILRSEEPARAKRDAARDAYQSAATAAQEAQDTAVAAVAQFLPEIQSGFEIA